MVRSCCRTLRALARSSPPGAWTATWFAISTARVPAMPRSLWRSARSAAASTLPSAVSTRKVRLHFGRVQPRPQRFGTQPRVLLVDGGGEELMAAGRVAAERPGKPAAHRDGGCHSRAETATARLWGIVDPAAGDGVSADPAAGDVEPALRGSCGAPKSSIARRRSPSPYWITKF